MRKVLNVPYIDQTMKWPTGCESVSSVMLCQYLGTEVTVDEFITEYLPMEPMQFLSAANTDGFANEETGTAETAAYADGGSNAAGAAVAHRRISDAYERNIGCGPHPDQYFAGSPYDEDSFGCYPGVIVTALNACFAGRAGANTGEALEQSHSRDREETDAVRRQDCAVLEAYDASGRDTEWYLEEIREGRPVVYWASIDLRPTISGPRWTLSKSAGQHAGTEFTWISNEHCMLLVGYDDGKDTLVFADPWHAHGIVDYDRSLVEKRHAEQDGRAVAVRKRDSKEQAEKFI